MYTLQLLGFSLWLIGIGRNRIDHAEQLFCIYSRGGSGITLPQVILVGVRIVQGK